MFKNCKYLFLAALSVVFIFVPAEAQVVINEIMWDEAEYIELYNAGENTVDITGWQVVVGADTEIVIDAGASIASGGFYLITDDGAVSFTPDEIDAMTLLQGGELVRLFDASGVVVDTANQDGAWFAGENTSEGVSMSRIDALVSGELSSNWANDSG